MHSLVGDSLGGDGKLENVSPVAFHLDFQLALCVVLVGDELLVDFLRLTGHQVGRFPAGGSSGRDFDTESADECPFLSGNQKLPIDNLGTGRRTFQGHEGGRIVYRE